LEEAQKLLDGIKMQMEEEKEQKLQSSLEKFNNPNYKPSTIANAEPVAIKTPIKGNAKQNGVSI
jgi:hypothetical protein